MLEAVYNTDLTHFVFTAYYYNSVYTNNKNCRTIS